VGVAVWRSARANSFALFAALWAIGILAAYSLVPYKTPWLALNFIVPLAIIGGYGVGEIYRSSKT
jgi:predicted membrane-bound mannosyltransferase